MRLIDAMSVIPYYEFITIEDNDSSVVYCGYHNDLEALAVDTIDMPSIITRKVKRIEAMSKNSMSARLTPGSPLTGNLPECGTLVVLA